MVGRRPENDCGEEDEYISRQLREEETEQQDWSPLGKTKAGAKSSSPPIIFSGLIRWEADLGFLSHNNEDQQSRITRIDYQLNKGGVAVPNVPKIQALPGWGGVWPLLGFFRRICPHALRALKGDHLSPKGDISPQKCSLFPRIDHSTTSI